MPYQILVDFDGLHDFRFADAFFVGVGQMNGAGSQQERPSPGISERRNIGGEGHHGTFESLEFAQVERGNAQHFLGYREAFDRLRDGGARGIARIHNADEYYRRGVIGNDVGRAAALNGADVQCADAKQWILGQLDLANARQSIE